MSQDAMPFYESAEEATKAAIAKYGRPLKDVASALWPSKSVEAAATALRNALNENRDERLTADQHIFIANLTRQYDWLHYAALRCSHSRPEPVAPEDQRAKLQREFVEAVNQLKVIEARLAENAPRLRAV